MDPDIKYEYFYMYTNQAHVKKDLSFYYFTTFNITTLTTLHITTLHILQNTTEI